MTITHRCQMKRFTNDIIRILKNKPQRSMSISEIPMEYGRKEFATFSRKMKFDFRNGV